MSEEQDAVVGELERIGAKLSWPRRKPGEADDAYNERCFDVGLKIYDQLNVLFGSPDYKKMSDAKKRGKVAALIMRAGGDDVRAGKHQAAERAERPRVVPRKKSFIHSRSNQ